MGNTRRSARAMDDADIGISLKMPLPEPERLTFKPLPPLPTTSLYSASETAPVATLPRMYCADSASAEAPLLAVRVSEGLQQVNYLPKLRVEPESGACGSVTFYVALDDQGAALHVLRVNPSGEETPWFKMLRKRLTRTRGTAAAAGYVTFTWNAKELP